MRDRKGDDPQRTRDLVRDHYARAAAGESCCSGSCAPAPLSLRDAARRLGYGDEEIASLPAAGGLTLGCGNPLGVAGLRLGETVLDLGSGAGFDALLAAERVGPAGRVIGVDMTPEVVARARGAAAGRDNVEFRLGAIEELPLADATVDVVISNCVINLSPEKARVFAEMHRVLRPGVRLAVADPVLLRSLAGTPWEGEEHVAACISGAVSAAEYETLLAAAGFTDISVLVDDRSAEVIRDWDPGSGVEEYVRSAFIRARKA